MKRHRLVFGVVITWSGVLLMAWLCMLPPVTKSETFAAWLGLASTGLLALVATNDLIRHLKAER